MSKSGEINLTLAIYKDKGLWGYSLPQLGLNFEGLTRNQAIMRATEKIRLCCMVPGDDISKRDLRGTIGEEIYNRPAGQERGE